MVGDSVGLARSIRDTMAANSLCLVPALTASPRETTSPRMDERSRDAVVVVLGVVLVAFVVVVVSSAVAGPTSSEAPLPLLLLPTSDDDARHLMRPRPTRVTLGCLADEGPRLGVRDAAAHRPDE